MGAFKRELENECLHYFGAVTPETMDKTTVILSGRADMERAGCFTCHRDDCWTCPTASWNNLKAVMV